jgi:hypothetical protein
VYAARGQLRDILHMSQGTAEAADPAVPGHWQAAWSLAAAQRAVGILIKRPGRCLLRLD